MCGSSGGGGEMISVAVDRSDRGRGFGRGRGSGRGEEEGRRRDVVVAFVTWL